MYNFPSASSVDMFSTRANPSEAGYSPAMRKYSQTHTEHLRSHATDLPLDDSAHSPKTATIETDRSLGQQVRVITFPLTNPPRATPGHRIRNLS